MKAGRVALPLYQIAGLLVLLPAIDVLAQLAAAPDLNRHWRFGAVGLISERLLLPLLGLTIALSVAVLCRHAGTLRALAVASLSAVLLGIFALADFALNSIQVWGATSRAARSSVAIMAVVALLKLMAALVFLGSAGLIAWRNQRSIRGEARVAPLAQAPLTVPNEPVGA